MEQHQLTRVCTWTHTQLQTMLFTRVISPPSSTTHLYFERLAYSALIQDFILCQQGAIRDSHGKILNPSHPSINIQIQQPRDNQQLARHIEVSEFRVLATFCTMFEGSRWLTGAIHSSLDIYTAGITIAAISSAFNILY